MKISLERILYELERTAAGAEGDGLLCRIDVRAKLLVTLLFLLCLLSLHRYVVARLLVMAAYPALLCIMGGIDYTAVFKRSLVALPFVLFIGIFNPIYEREVAAALFGINISAGWISMLSLAVRGVVAVQAVVLLLYTSGFHSVCRALSALGMPHLLVSLLVSLHRYLFILLDEAVGMSRSISLRGYGRSSYPLRLWSAFIGGLLLRSIDRAERIERAMTARCFTGRFRYMDRLGWHRRDTLYLILASAAILFIRFC